MKFDNYYKLEPGTYKDIYEKSSNLQSFLYNINLKNSDNHSQIKNAKLYANRLHLFITKILNKKEFLFLDCGCGLGFLARELKKMTVNNLQYCDPSEYINKIHKKFYPYENFFQSDIQNLNKFNKKFDIIYLREVYPFTRENNFENQKNLIEILNNQLNDNGILILEQIKNNKDLFCNINKFKFDIKSYKLLPIKWHKFEFINILYFKSFYLQYLINLIYKILDKQITYFIVIKKYIT